MLEEVRRGNEHAYPAAVVLPVGAGAPASRWVVALGCGPDAPETKVLLCVADAASFEDLATVA